MTPADSTKGPGLPAQKSNIPAAAPASQPEKAKRWFEYDPPEVSANATTQGPEPVAQDPAAKERAAAVLPQKRRLFWSWNFTLAVGEEETFPIKGRCFMDFHNDPRDVTAFLRSCDNWFNAAIPGNIESFVRDCVQQEVAKVAGPGEVPKTEVLVKLVYDIKVWAAGERPYEWNETKDYPVKLDRQVRGHVMAVMWSFERYIFSSVRAAFRDFAAGWIQRLPPSAAGEKALAQIRREQNHILEPDTLEADQLPPAIEDVEIAAP